MVAGGSQQEILVLGFVLIGTRQQGKYFIFLFSVIY
ncbi:unnamed protein product [Schistosoma curassoni]|uniref:Uncharacterized protein n=1 Tax=Schistosoma curassoni TaxID=6186 RepID=A0A183JTC2_9TREM|nr:unnamed protein product [Schistosoma curassoni]